MDVGTGVSVTALALSAMASSGIESGISVKVSRAGS